MMQWIRLAFILPLLCGATVSGADPEIWQDLMLQGRNANSELRYFHGNTAVLRDQLSLAPTEFHTSEPYIIHLPMPDGRLVRYEVVESSIMEPGLAAAFDQIKTYKLHGIDDPTASGRATITPHGFDAMIQTSVGRVFIDLDTTASMGGNYKVFYHRAIATQGYSCGVHQGSNVLPNSAQIQTGQANRLQGSYLTYRLAVAATDNYVSATGGSVSAAQAQIVTTINRVNQIYERDMGIRLLLVANNDDLIETEDTGCLSNNDSFAVLSESPVWIDTIIGNSSYDIGHVLTTNGGGVALIESVCDANFKASGTSGRANPIGDPFYIDIVAHEIGHQFGAEHTFNGSAGACQGNRNGATAYEPGSGSSIMSYSGICAAENLQASSDAMFHAGSIGQINTYTGGGGSCYVALANGNSDPTLSGTPDLTIPRDTPFVLDNGSAADADLDTLTYTWDQMDAGSQTSATTFGRDLGDNPLFRSYAPQSQSSRDFPALGTQLQVPKDYDDAETFACSARDLNFRLTVRDNASGQITDNVRVTVDRNSGPFRITSYNTAQTITSGAGPITLTWDDANTRLPPVNCATVDIDLLTFDDASYTNYSVHPILAVTSNDGTEDVTIIPVTDSHPRARLRVKCTNSGFYDISDADLVIDGTDPTPIFFSDTGNATFFNSLGTTLSGVAPVCGVPRGVAAALPVPPTTAGAVSLRKPYALPKFAAKECSLPRPTPRNGDASSVDLAWMIFLGLLAVGLNLLRARVNFRADSAF